MSIEKKTDAELEHLSLQYKSDIKDLQRSLEIIPLDSILGRMGIQASIRLLKRKLENVNHEIEVRKEAKSKKESK